MSYYIFSTCAQDNTYIKYIKSEHTPVVAVCTPEKSVLIRGGTGVIDGKLFTPMGVVTKVSDQDYEDVLKDNAVFKQHVKDSFIRVEKKGGTKPEQAAKSMNLDDHSRQRTNKDFELDRANFLKARLKADISMPMDNQARSGMM